MNKNLTALYGEGIMRNTVRNQEEFLFRSDASYS